MIELIELLTRVLDADQERDVAQNLRLLVLEIEGVRTVMDRHAKALEALVPSAARMAQLADRQDELLAMTQGLAADVRWTREQLDGEVDGPM